MDPLLLAVIKEMKKDIRALDEKMDEMLKFKWKIMGGTLVISFLVAIAFHVAELVIK